MTVSLIERYLYFFTGLCSLPECFYFGKLSHFVDFLNTVGSWFITFLFNTWRTGIVWTLFLKVDLLMISAGIETGNVELPLYKVLLTSSFTWWGGIFGSLISTMLQTSFSLYLHNQWTVFYKLSWSGKLQMRAICIYMEYTKVTTNNQDIRLSVTVKSLFANI